MHSIKCVVWDLDNTLWDGILSEACVIKLRQETLDVLTKLNQIGIVNSICSRNDYDIALAKLKEFKIDHLFIYPQISWQPKSCGVKRIIRDLHFRPHNILFVDDTAFERDEVTRAFPDILTCDVKEITSLLNKKLLHPEVSSQEAQNRIAMYKSDERRLQDGKNFDGSNTDFLVSCHIEMNVRAANAKDLDRMKELIDRTNQLNSTGVRYEKEQIFNMLECSDYQIFVADIWDKYGSYGRSGLVIGKVENQNYNILQLIVSCRLMGKGIAQALLAYVSRYVEQHYNCTSIRLCYKKTRFNRQMLLLYTMNGFLKIKQRDSVDVYELHLSDKQIEWPEWITLKKEGVSFD